MQSTPLEKDKLLIRSDEPALVSDSFCFRLTGFKVSDVPALVYDSALVPDSGFLVPDSKVLVSH